MHKDLTLKMPHECNELGKVHNLARRRPYNVTWKLSYFLRLCKVCEQLQ